MTDRRPPMRERRENRRRPKRRADIIVTLVAIVLFAFGLLSMIGLFGDTLKGFFTGAFGFMGYVLFAGLLVLTVAKGFKILRKRVAIRTIVYVAVLSFLVLLYLQIVTSFKEFELLLSAEYKAYIDACYTAGLGTAGGVLLGWIAYPLLSWMGKIAAIPLAVIFFIVLFFALLPMMRGATDEGAGRAPKEKAPRAEKKAAKKEEELLLFVDKVRPGQKDAAKIKTRGLFSKKGPEPAFFDYNDDRPLYAPEGVVPEEEPRRYDAYAGERTTPEDEYDYEDYTPTYDADTRRSRSEYSSYRDEEEPADAMPAFVRRYADEQAQAARRLYGDDDISSYIPNEPTFDKKDAESAKPTQETPAPRVEHVKPKARPSDIIMDMSDLHRLRAKEDAAPKRSAFLGETPADEPPAQEKSLESPKEESSFSRPIFRETPVSQAPAAPKPFTADPAPVEDPAPAAEPESESTPLLRKESTITPRESSFLRPVETPRASAEPTPRYANERATAPEAPNPSSFFVSDEEEAPIRTRKPRSDIGGTHRTQDAPRPTDGYIPPKKVEQMDIEKAMKEEEEAPARPYTPPPVSLLTDFPPIQDEEGVEERAEMLVQALSSFNITSEVIDHKTGPTFTRFAVTLPDNMSVNKLTPLEKDIKRKLKVEKNIRIIPSVPGLDAIGIEVPNKKTSTVGLRSIINSPDFSKEGKLFFAIGVDVSGKPIYGDLLKMPHLLVAGSTGSGKSVCLNVLITSMMYHYSPETVRFIMIDPKKVELSVYKNMPHMLMPSTVTEPDKAINALSWAVNEMERRYQLLMENSCRNIGEYNALQKKTGGKKLYYIVFIIDEMADLMYAAKRDVEEKVNRIAAKARAAGIHLVVATQRPSVDVITGTIKNNIPTRIAFKVTSFTDSKTILDRAGAESLFGNGDMLYTPPEGGDPIRLQGPYINDEISEIVSFIKEHNDCRFDSAAERIIQADKEESVEPQGEGGGEDGDGEDEFFAPALLYFIEIGQASISKLQIKYHIGYGRAARIVETMAERGYLGPAEGGNKSRQVRISREEYYELYGEDGIDGEEV